MNKIGIDPGLTGAIAWLDSNNKFIDVWDMPTMSRGKKGNQVNPVELGEIIREITREEPCIAYVEQVHAMPGQGVVSMFNFGESFGVIKGVLGSLMIPVEFVTPVQWKTRAALKGKDKDAARTKAINMYPNASLSRKKDIGRADALMIARYGE